MDRLSANQILAFYPYFVWYTINKDIVSYRKARKIFLKQKGVFFKPIPFSVAFFFSEFLFLTIY